MSAGHISSVASGLPSAVFLPARDDYLGLLFQSDAVELAGRNLQQTPAKLHYIARCMDPSVWSRNIAGTAPTCQHQSAKATSKTWLQRAGPRWWLQGHWRQWESSEFMILGASFQRLVLLLLQLLGLAPIAMRSFPLRFFLLLL